MKEIGGEDSPQEEMEIRRIRNLFFPRGKYHFFIFSTEKNTTLTYSSKSEVSIWLNIPEVLLPF